MAHDASQPPHDSVALERLIATGGVLSHSEQTSVNESVLVRTIRFAVPADASILIEASVAVDYAGMTDLDFASGDDFRVGCPNCFVTMPRQMNP